MCFEPNETGPKPAVRADPSALLSAHLDRLYSLFFRRLRRHHDAEDLVNDTITLVLIKWEKYDPARPFWPWLATIAQRQLATAARSGKLQYHIPLAEDTDQTADTPVDAAPLALDVLVRHEDHDRLRTAIDELPPSQRETVLLYYFDDLSAKEIAEMESVPLGTVYRRLSDARARLVADLIPSGRQVSVSRIALEPRT